MTVPRVFGLPHLSEDAVAAFADGVLSDTAAARARKHCSECAECAQAVRVQRETALMLRTASNPTMPAGLMDRLTHLPMSAPMPPPNSGLPTVLGADGVPMFVAHNPPPRKRPDEDKPEDKPTGHHRRALLPVGILASAAAVVAAGTLGGNASTLPQPNEPQPQQAAVRPVADTLLTPPTRSSVFVPVRNVLATSPRAERP